jgi:hypothetical protein
MGGAYGRTKGNVLKLAWKSATVSKDLPDRLYSRPNHDAYRKRLLPYVDTGATLNDRCDHFLYPFRQERDDQRLHKDLLPRALRTNRGFLRTSPVTFPHELPSVADPTVPSLDPTILSHIFISGDEAALNLIDDSLRNH